MTTQPLRRINRQKSPIMSRRTLLAALFVFATAFTAEGRSFRVDEVPNGAALSCATCHVDPNGAGARNNFGIDVETFFLDAAGSVLWGSDLAMLDSDGDGFTNGDELGDPEGFWSAGDDPPPFAATYPGDAASSP